MKKNKLMLIAILALPLLGQAKPDSFTSVNNIQPPICVNVNVNGIQDITGNSVNCGGTKSLSWGLVRVVCLFKNPCKAKIMFDTSTLGSGGEALMDKTNEPIFMSMDLGTGKIEPRQICGHVKDNFYKVDITYPGPNLDNPTSIMTKVDSCP